MPEIKTSNKNSAKVLSSDEEKARLDEIEEVSSKHISVQKKLQELQPKIDDIIKDVINLDKSVRASSFLRFIHAEYFFRTALLFRSVMSFRHLMQRIVKDMEASTKRSSRLEQDILDPTIPYITSRVSGTSSKSK